MTIKPIYKKGLNYICISGSVGACIHPMVTVTQTNSYTEAKVERSTTDSSPQSQMSRTSSKKSNTSVLVTNGKIEGK